MTDRLSTVIDALDRWANPERAKDWAQIPGLPENYYELSLADKAALLRDLLAAKRAADAEGDQAGIYAVPPVPIFGYAKPLEWK